ncbi:unnamed protein product [Anisakis simplex]|uniref:DUF4789 domain-containing protein n=1 Tax=Anisakis simplex TaxID=6269 RepID=A0A0M3K173_ANISI|nr:unnamed protein product [Anisakis simplex]
MEKNEGGNKTPNAVSETPGTATQGDSGSRPRTPEVGLSPALSPATSQSQKDGGTPANSIGSSVKSGESSFKGDWADQVAPDDRMDDKSLPEPGYLDKEIGEETEKRISPLIRNRKVRYLTVINFFLSALNIILMLILVALLIHFIVLLIKRQDALGTIKMPCLYRFGDWSECSAECWNETSGQEEPFMVRKVRPETIVQARGGYPPCPLDLAQSEDRAPCNFYKCPKKLSEYPIDRNNCYYNDINKGEKGGCYAIRKLPLDEYRLIEIDTHLTETCPCPDLIP